VRTVCLLGADGAGKSTVGRRLPAVVGVPAAYVYMGVNLDASDVVLPTTRALLWLKRRLGGRADLAPPRSRSGAGTEVRRGALARTRQVVRMVNLVAEEWYRQVLVWRHHRRGELVVLDRHFRFDYHHHDVAPHGPLPIERRVHGWLLRRYPLPDLVVVLDAPAEVLHARKGEGTLASLDERRRAYLQLRELADSSVVVDAARPLDTVVAEVIDIVRTHVGVTDRRTPRSLR
jgi:thymidylate kinase